MPWLNVSGRDRIDNTKSVYTQKLYASSNTTITEGSSQGHYTEITNADEQIYADVMANVNKTFGDDWSLVANVGASINDVRSRELSYRGPIRDSGVPNLFTVFDLDREKSRAQKWGWQEQTQSLFGSVEVGWKQMLYLTLTGRNDWASQLAGSPQKSFFYPSVGLSWIPTATFDLPDAFSYLKLRASFSSVGIPFPRFLTTPTYAYDETTQQWLPTTFREIGQLYPERTKTWEVGLDARLWNDVRLSASWYLADTSNQTFQPTVSTSSGYSSMYVQTGCVRNTGVEASLGYGHTWRDFSWDTNVTFTWNRNEILDLMDGMCDPMTGEPLKDRLEIKGLGKAKYILKKGGTMGDLYTTSNLKYDENGYIQVDRNGNFVTTDVGEEIYLGSVLPDYNLAWRNDFSWKGAHLGILFTGRIGGICYSATQANMDLFGVSETSAAARDAGGVRPAAMVRRDRLAVGTAALLHLFGDEFPAAGAFGGLYAAAPLVPRCLLDRRLVRGPQPLDDLLQGAVRSRSHRFDGQQLPGHRLLHGAVAAQSGLQPSCYLLKPKTYETNPTYYQCAFRSFAVAVVGLHGGFRRDQP